MMAGILVISLDLELHWGRMDKIELSERVKQQLINSRNIIPEKLKLFETAGIHATWATVGLLFNHTPKEYLEDRSQMDFVRRSKHLTKCNDFAEVSHEENSKFYFASDLIKQIMGVKGQEIGTHTYSHFCYFENGADAAGFRADLIEAKKMAAKWDINLRSMVFPRNQYDDKCLDICAEEGIKTVRTNPPDWYWTPDTKGNLVRKLFRTGDAYMPLGRSKVYKNEELQPQTARLPVCLPASRLYRKWDDAYPFLNTIKLNRIKDEMTNAAITNGFYHLWWHPENFGDDPEECLSELKEIAEHFLLLKDKYGFTSLNMIEAGDILHKYD